MRGLLVLWLLLSGCAGMATPSQGQDSAAPATRKVVRKSIPVYPEMARRMNLTGTVKVFAVVAPDGSVKAVQPMGGSPLLIQAAQEAISTWKFAPASAESKELIELHFNPN
jgi:TonB family protein